MTGRGAMQIDLEVHIEATGDRDEPAVWWAETEQVPGFSASAPHLAELLERTEAALSDILGDEVALKPNLTPVESADSPGSAGAPNGGASDEGKQPARNAVRVFPPALV